MLISDVIKVLEAKAPPSLQEEYDNAGLLTGNSSWPCKGMLISLDVTEAVIDEAIAAGFNLVISHHPIIFKGLKKINGKNFVERIIIKALKNDVALYAIHTNLDNVFTGVNGKIADLLGLTNRQVLAPKGGHLCKLVTFSPLAHTEKIKEALHAAGAGNIGNYSECSFTILGTGNFKGNEETTPFLGEPGKRHHEDENRIEVILPNYLQKQVVNALKAIHPYEEVAYDIYMLANDWQDAGSGMIGELRESLLPGDFLALLKKTFRTGSIRHTEGKGSALKKIALCGGAGIFLLPQAIAAGADVFITGDVKYHEFFEADDNILLADIGHYESEQFTTDLLFDILRENFPNFAVLKTGVNTNPVRYYS
ncbi:MAG: Nif3-like dinuclear metal center hexameric protein [Ferruginibacter sp.]